MAADEQTEGYAEAMNEAIAAATRAEAEVRGIKRKYEPDDGVIMDKMLQLSDDHYRVYMRVLIRTGEYLLLEIVDNVRLSVALGPLRRTLSFRPAVQGKRDNMQDFGSYGVYEVYIGDGTFVHSCLVRFDQTGVSLTPIHEPVVQGDGPLVINELTTPPAVTLAISNDAA
jgi:hypothetical protein